MTYTDVNPQWETNCLPPANSPPQPLRNKDATTHPHQPWVSPNSTQTPNTPSQPAAVSQPSQNRGQRGLSGTIHDTEEEEGEERARERERERERERSAKTLRESFIRSYPYWVLGGTRERTPHHHATVYFPKHTLLGLTDYMSKTFPGL